MGVLDTYNTWQQDTDMESPNNQRMMAIAAALLSAGGPSLKPISMGQAIGNAMQFGQQAYQGAEDRALMKQMKNEELKMKKLQEQRAQTEFENLQGWNKRMSGAGNIGTQSQAATQQPMKMAFDGSGNASFQSQPDIKTAAQPGQNSWLANASIDDLIEGARYGAKGMKEALEAKKFALEGIKRSDNTTYIDPITLKPTYYADPTKGLDYNPETRTVTGLTGFNKANAEMKGAEQAAIEQAKAANDLVTLTLPTGPVQMTRAQVLQSLGQQTPQVQQQPMQGQSPTQGLPQPGNSTQAELNQRSTQLRANQPQMDNDRLTILQQELAAERDPNNRAALQREIARVGGGQAPQQQFAPQAQNQPRFGIPLQSEAQKQAEIEAAKKSVNLQFDPLIEQQTGSIKGKQGTKNDLNQNWIKQSFNPVQEAGARARDVSASLDTLTNVDFKTGWGADAKVAAANALVGLGLAPKNAEFYAANGQVFKSEIMKQLVQTFEGQKGTQTEGDAKRVQQTFAEISNTPLANQFIADLARAKANRDAKKAAFYTKALPLAEAEGDLNQVDRRWMKLQTSIWDDPVLQKYKREAK